MEVIKSNTCGNKLCSNAYIYTQKAPKKNRIRWVCGDVAAHSQR